VGEAEGEAVDRHLGGTLGEPQHPQYYESPLELLWSQHGGHGRLLSPPSGLPVKAFPQN
jgi:hypothetical protein